MQVIYQNEVSECGYACLAMVLTHLGRATAVSELSEFRPVSANGAKLSDLYDMAEEFGLAVDAMVFEPQHIPDIKKGSIVHFGGTHFVIFESCRRGAVRMIDPASGRRRISLETFIKNTSGYLLECRPTPALPRIESRSEIPAALRRIFTWNPALKSQLLKILFVSIGAQFAVLAMPYLGSMVLDHVVAENNLSLLSVLIISFASFFIVGTFSSYMQAYLTEVVCQHAQKASTESLFAKLLRNRFSYFEKRHVGDIYARVKSQTEIVEFAGRDLVKMCADLSIGLLALVLMLVQSPVLAAIALAFFVVYLCVACLIYPAMQDSYRQQSEASALCDDALIETIRSASLLKLAQRESQRTSFYMARFQGYINDSFRAHNLGNLRTAILKCVDYADLLVITYVSAEMMIKGKVSVGVFYSFLIFKGLMSAHLAGAVNSIFQLLLLRVPIARVNDILQHEGERYTDWARRHQASETREFEQLSLTGVGFSYGVSDRPVLRGVDFTLSKGDKVAIIGPSGAGKSTLFKLLAAAESAQQGRIRLNGMDYSNLAVDEIRQHMAHMRQGDIILNGTIAENISLFDAAADSKRINQILRDVGLYEDVMALPMRTQTLVSDTIANVSAGQRQRLLLARALFQDRELMLLDEPTSNLDPDAVQVIGRLLANCDKTLLLITHDTALAALFERRYALRGGKLEAL